MNPILAKDAVILFKKNDEWLAYQCATDVEIDFTMETKSVKTIGDGTWSKDRGQKKSYQINISGLIKFDDEAYPHSFDLYGYYDAMTSIEYRMVFTTEDSSQLRKIEGLALPTNVTMGGGSEGFAYGNVVLKGDGAPEITDAISSCEAEITDGEMVLISGENGFKVNALNNGPVTRYDYSIDGGGRQTAFVDGTLPDQFSIGNGIGATGSEHDLTVWPICDDGFDGEPFEITFENQP
jgi:hypothetical protein